MSVAIPLKAKYLHPVKGTQKATQSEGAKKTRKKLTGDRAKAERAITAAGKMELWIVNGRKQWRRSSSI
jgi:hypothetical protein